MKAVAVFFGGQSVEHDISIITGVMTANSIKVQNFTPIPVYISKTGLWFTGKQLLDLDNYKSLNLNKLTRVCLTGGDNSLYQIKKNKLKKIDALSVAINCMHGERGEDGALKGLLSMCNIPLASPDMMPSSICIDKTFTKTVLRAINVKTLPSLTVSSIEEVLKNQKKFTYPLIVKPNKLGSSIGVSRVENQTQLYSAVNYALRFGDKAIIEKCLENFIEINCACYLDSHNNLIVSECERPIGRTEVLSFDDKYKNGKRVFPADISTKLAEKIKSTTKQIYQKLNFTGVIRIDYFIVEEQIFVNEINTVPGSLAYYLFGDTIKSFQSLLEELLQKALKDYAQSLSTQKTYKADILSFTGGKSAKRL